MIDVVIPTYNRIDYLNKLLKSIEEQTMPVNQIYIVFAGVKVSDLDAILKGSSLNIQAIPSEPSVCKQRNIGIKNCNSDYIFLCDDDIVLPKNYLQKLVDFLEKSPESRIATGEEFQFDTSKIWKPVYEELSHANLWFKYIFGLTIFSDVSKEYYSKNRISHYISKKLLEQQNRTSAAGWPRMCSFSYPVSETAIYGLGASLIRTSYLKNNLYNENLPQHCIGDNYEVALNINEGKHKIAMLRDVHFKHFKAPSNRVSKVKSYTQRIYELKRVVFTSHFFTLKNSLYFTWSLTGNAIYFLVKGNWSLFFATIKLQKIAAFEVLKQMVYGRAN